MVILSMDVFLKMTAHYADWGVGCQVRILFLKHPCAWNFSPKNIVTWAI